VSKTSTLQHLPPLCKKNWESKGEDGGFLYILKGPIAIPGYRSGPDLQLGGGPRSSACQIQEGSCGLATHSRTSAVWKSEGGGVLAALPKKPFGVVLKESQGGEDWAAQTAT
jgi:hypothetical protein